MYSRADSRRVRDRKNPNEHRRTHRKKKKTNAFILFIFGNRKRTSDHIEKKNNNNNKKKMNSCLKYISIFYIYKITCCALR